MRCTRTRLSILLSLATLSTTACDQPEPADPPAVSDASHDPGTSPVPTTDTSYSLMQKPGARRDFFQRQLTILGRSCPLVTEAVLKGGFEGTDYWRVSCRPEGEWLVELRDDRPVSVVSCGDPAARCRDNWQAPSGR